MPYIGSALTITKLGEQMHCASSRHVPSQDAKTEVLGPQEWEMFEDIPLSMQPSPVIRILNLPGAFSLPYLEFGSPPPAAASATQNWVLLAFEAGALLPVCARGTDE